ncbi:MULTISPECIES: hypothetical protein [Xanthobacter]|uniref:hypothetical protein n=1 Tax=Xanthobacter TaxID=279 RepID=UPI0024ACD694|nr:hypothetical protein [Xanthobacter autotrophicus]
MARIALCAVPLAVPLMGWGTARADPVPLPAVDFAVSADLRRGGTMELAHSQGKMRVEMVKPNVPGSIVGIIDLRARRMVVRTPNLPNMAVEIELPPEYALGALSGSGLRVGESQVAGEPCDLWKLDTQMSTSVGPTTACITPDGIALRTEVEVQGRKQTVFEALKLTRAPQDPKLFQLPAGVQVMKVPKGKIGTALGLPGLGAPLLDPVPPAAPKP